MKAVRAPSLARSILGRRLARRLVFVGLALATTTALLDVAIDADAQAQAKKPAPRPAAKPPAKKPPPKPDDLDAAAPMATKEASEPAVGPARDAGKTGAAVLDQKTLDGGQRVFRFGEVEVEGRLKSPQIVYFLRRVRAEFAASDLGHRSFMTELGETKHDPSF